MDQRNIECRSMAQNEQKKKIEIQKQVKYDFRDLEISKRETIIIQPTTTRRPAFECVIIRMALHQIYKAINIEVTEVSWKRSVLAEGLKR